MTAYRPSPSCWLHPVLLLLLLSACHAVYEEQVGEYDWHIKQIGVIERAFQEGKRVYVSTKSSVLASMNAVTGDIDWRVILPREAKVVKFVVGTSALYSISNENVIQAWSIDSGKLQWDLKLSLNIISFSDDVELMLNGENLFVLIERCYFVINIKSGTSKYQFCPRLSSFPKELAQWENVQLSSLVYSETSYSGKIHAAVGCISNDKNDVCQSIAILDLLFDKENVEYLNMHVVSLAHEEDNPFELSKVFSSIGANAMGKFDDQDFVCGISVKRHVKCISLSKKAAFNFEPKINVMNERHQVKWFAIFDRKSGILHPLLQLCSDMDCSLNLIKYDTHSSGIEFVEKYELTLCSNIQPGSLTKSSTFGIQSISTFETIGSNLYCTQGIRNDDSSSKVTTVIYDHNLNIIDQVSSDFVFEPFLRAFSWTSFQNEVAKTKFLAVSVSGDSIFIANNKIKWTKHESLSNVIETQLFDHSVALVQNSLEDISIPDPATRMKMQKQEIKKFLLNTYSTLVGIPKSSFFSDMLSSMFSSVPDEIKALLKLFGVQLDQRTGSTVQRVRIEKNTNRLTDAHRFGFNKIAVHLTSRCPLEPVGQKFTCLKCLQGLKVVGQDLVNGKVAWSFVPAVEIVPTEKFTHFQLYAKLLKMRHHGVATEATLVVSVIFKKQQDEVVGSQLLTYTFEVQKGVSVAAHMDKSVAHLNKQHIRVPSSMHQDVSFVTNIVYLSNHVRSFNDELLKPTYLFVHDNHRASFFPVTKHTNFSSLGSSSIFAYAITNDRFTTYKIANSFDQSCKAANQCFFQGLLYQPTLYELQEVGNFVMDSSKDRFVGFGFPSVESKVHSRTKILGDDSLLLKYHNQNLIVLLTCKQRTFDDSVPLSSDNFTTLADSKVQELFVTVVDSVSGQVIYRYSIVHGQLPAAVGIVENNVIVTYWNSEAHRSELSSVSLYEGMIDKYGLNPFSDAPVKKFQSSFNSFTPIALQKTYILPHLVTGIHHTITKRGITNKDILLSLSSGQVLALDLRMIDPRRPVGQPNNFEKEEALVMYNPFLHLPATNYLTHREYVPGIQKIVATDTKLESTSLILCLGLDIYFTRVTPSKTFDMLSSNFNKPLLTLIIIGMGIAVVLLHRKHKKKLLLRGWS